MAPGRTTGEAVQRIARTDARVSYLRHDTNQGRSATRNTGIRQARGDIVLLVDDDVVVDPGYVKAHLDAHAAAEPAAVAVIGDLRFPPRSSPRATTRSISSHDTWAAGTRRRCNASARGTCIRDS